jgi:hypothetical protein
MGRPQLGFPRLCFVAVTANGIAIGLDHTPTRRQAPFFCPVPDTKPRIPLSALRKRGPACPTTNSSAATARRSSIRSFPSLITRKATLSARTAEARRSSSAGRPSPPSRRERAHECAGARPAQVDCSVSRKLTTCGGAIYTSPLSTVPALT